MIHRKSDINYISFIYRIEITFPFVKKFTKIEEVTAAEDDVGVEDDQDLDDDEEDICPLVLISDSSSSDSDSEFNFGAYAGLHGAVELLRRARR